MFGIPYDQAVAWGSTIIPGVPDLVTYSCAFIDSSDYDEEGLFRISPMKTALDSLCDKFDRGETPPPFSTINDINIVTGMLKKFIRELPRSPFLELKRTPEDDSPRALFEALPLDSRHFVQLLFYIFHKVVLNKDKTKMGHSNIMIVVPTLIPGSVCTKYYESFIVDYDSIFNPDELPLPKNWPHLF